MDLNRLFGLKTEPPSISPGDTVRVVSRYREGDKERSQIFEGTVIRVRKGGINSSFTVRRVSYGIGVERTFFLHSPLLEEVKVLKHGRTRRAKLYYLRGLSARAAKEKAAPRSS